MTVNPRRFWHTLQTGIEVAVASSNPQKLLGVRDGFMRFTQQRLPNASAVVVIPQEVALAGPSLPLSDEETTSLVLNQAKNLREKMAGSYLFYVAAEGGLDTVETSERHLFLTRYWAAISCDLGHAVGSSSGLQLPDRIMEGLDQSAGPLSMPGGRRKGGMLGSLTAGATTQRAAVADATFNSLSTLFYGFLDANSIPSEKLRELI